MKERNLKKAKDVSVAEKEDLRQRWDAFWNELVANTANMPLAIHWSLKSGILPNEIWSTVFALINGITTFRGGWAATAMCVPGPVIIPESDEATSAVAGSKQGL